MTKQVQPLDALGPQLIATPEHEVGQLSQIQLVDDAVDHHLADRVPSRCIGLPQVPIPLNSLVEITLTAAHVMPGVRPVDADVEVKPVVRDPSNRLRTLRGDQRAVCRDRNVEVLGTGIGQDLLEVRAHEWLTT